MSREAIGYPVLVPVADCLPEQVCQGEPIPLPELGKILVPNGETALMIGKRCLSVEGLCVYPSEESDIITKPAAKVSLNINYPGKIRRTLRKVRGQEPQARIGITFPDTSLIDPSKVWST